MEIVNYTAYAKSGAIKLQLFILLVDSRETAQTVEDGDDWLSEMLLGFWNMGLLVKPLLFQHQEFEIG